MDPIVSGFMDFTFSDIALKVIRVRKDTYMNITIIYIYAYNLYRTIISCSRYFSKYVTFLLSFTFLLVEILLNFLEIKSRKLNISSRL